MSVELKRKSDKIIRIFNMQDGQIGIITRSMCSTYKNMVVQRAGQHLFVVGRSIYWKNYFDKESYNNDNDMVCLLEDGDTLVVHQ